MKILNSIGITAAFKGFVIFLVYGVLTTLYVAIKYGFDTDLPASTLSALEGPLSIITFGWLAFVGSALLMFTTMLGTKPSNLETNRPKRVFWLSLPICEAAIALGVVIGATLFGMALASHILFMIDFSPSEIHILFYSLASAMFVLTYPVAFITIACLDDKGEFLKQLSSTLIFYIFLILSNQNITHPVENIGTAGITMLVLMIILAIYRYVKVQELRA